MKRILTSLLTFLLLIPMSSYTLSGCTNGNNDQEIMTNTDNIILEYFNPNLTEGVLEFTHSIMNFEHFDRIIPLGQINPPGHTFPTDHIYFLLNGISRPVYAPAGGKILHIEEPNSYGDRAIRVAVTSTMTYYLGHVFINEGLKVGDEVVAGEQIAISGNTSCVDFGLLNKNIDNGFLSQKLPLTTIYGDKPLSYYNEQLRTQLYELVKPPIPAEDHDYVYDGNVTDGEFALDKAGTLLGNWIREGSLRSDGWYEWKDTLAFGHDIYYPNQILIGVGDYSNAFAIKNEDNPIRPENVSTSSGAVVYYLYNANNTSKGIPMGSRIGLMMVQMVSDNRIKLEVFNDVTSINRQFTNAASFYTR